MTEDQGQRPQGRRHNGLSASSYLPLDDVDPRVGEHLLDVLYLAGIAAYLKPTQDTDALTRATSLPRHPIDRVWVDKTRLDEARDLLGAEAAEAGRTGRQPEPAASARDGDSDIDAAFASIVAGYDQTYRDPANRWTLDEQRPADPVGQTPEVEPTAPDVLEPAGPRDWLPGEGPPEDETYVPPPPPPLPRVSRGTAAALTIILGGIVLLIWPQLLNLSGDLALGLPLGAIIVGVVVLVWRMYDGPSVDDGPDDGAVV